MINLESKYNATVKGRTFYMDKILRDNLDLCKELITQDMDFIWVVDGSVGSGKSAFAQVIGWYLSNGKLTIDDVVFTANEFKDRVRKAKKHSCIIWDECFRGIAKGRHMTKQNMQIKELLLECRDKNLFILLCTPSYTDIEQSLIRDRIKGVFHVDMKIDKDTKKVRRGIFKFYSNKKILACIASPDDNKYPIRSNFYGRWSRYYWKNDVQAKLYDGQYLYFVGSKAYLNKKRGVLARIEKEVRSEQEEGREYNKRLVGEEEPNI